MRLLLAFLLVSFASACVAQPSDSESNELDCSNITISPQLDDCVKRRLAGSNKLLAKAMTDFEKRAKQMYAPDPALGKELIDKVKKSQDAWLSFRDKNCIVEAFEVEEGTPAYVTTVNNCTIRMNGERLEALKKLL